MLRRLSGCIRASDVRLTWSCSSCGQSSPAHLLITYFQDAQLSMVAGAAPLGPISRSMPGVGAYLNQVHSRRPSQLRCSTADVGLVWQLLAITGEQQISGGVRQFVQNEGYATDKCHKVRNLLRALPVCEIIDVCRALSISGSTDSSLPAAMGASLLTCTLNTRAGLRSSGLKLSDRRRLVAFLSTS